MPQCRTTTAASAAAACTSPESGTTLTLSGGAATISEHGEVTDNGGGIYAGSSATISLDGGSITGNTAQFGGGIYSGDGGAVTVLGGAQVTYHRARSIGSGIYVSGEATDLTVTGAGTAVSTICLRQRAAASRHMPGQIWSSQPALWFRTTAAALTGAVHTSQWRRHYP
ncbi:MAG: hypothetical protein IPK19_20715 [Chloroflexi bacterium]|nr:hypothetical protein [Chloroflexota bacterium]